MSLINHRVYLCKGDPSKDRNSTWFFILSALSILIKQEKKIQACCLLVNLLTKIYCKINFWSKFWVLSDFFFYKDRQSKHVKNSLYFWCKLESIWHIFLYDDFNWKGKTFMQKRLNYLQKCSKKEPDDKRPQTW